MLCGGKSEEQGRIQMRVTVVAAAVAVVASIAGAQADPTTTQGIGLARCEKLGADLKPELGLKHLPNALMYYWAQGYMSAANIAMLENNSQYVDLSKYDENTILGGVKQFCTQYPDRKPISFIDRILNKADKIKGEWKQGTIPWASSD
jgi:hypothetical protein